MGCSAMFLWSSRVPVDHPLRVVRKLTDAVLGSLSAEFDALSSTPCHSSSFTNRASPSVVDSCVLLSYVGHALVENRNGLIAAAMVTQADGFAERDAALLMRIEQAVAVWLGSR
jgi:hypothetical protein